jgi:molybdopterin/thiamine biosynthesis adenylyltransferase
MSLSDPQIERYSRQIVLPEIGGRGQERLLGSAAAVLGTDEAAATAALYLAGAGVGRIEVYPGLTESAAAATALARAMLALNPEVRVKASRLPDSTSERWICGHDAVVCASDSAILERAVAADPGGHRLIAGGVTAAGGWLWVGRGNQAPNPCALCAERDALAGSPAENDGPLASAAAGVIGSLLSLAALKTVLGLGDEPSGWWQYDAGTQALMRRQGAAPCGHRRALAG